jgi:hypothetical protein
MTSSPIARHGDALVVFDGPRRIAWERTGRAEWTPRGVWAGDPEVRRQLAARRPLLVVLDGPQASVTVLAEQFAAGRDALAPYVADPTGEAVEVVIPALDWLDRGLRARGLAFADRQAALPAALRAPLALDDEPGPVRFALRSGPVLDLETVVAHAFGGRLEALAA